MPIRRAAHGLLSEEHFTVDGTLIEPLRWVPVIPALGIAGKARATRSSGRGSGPGHGPSWRGRSDVAGARSQRIRGAWFSGSSTLVNSAVQAVKLVLLARLLSPEDFGVAGIAMVLIACGSILADLGVGVAVIQKETVPESILSRLYGVGLATGAGGFLVLALASPLVARVYGEPRVAPVLAALATVFLMLPVGALHQALAEKRLAFKRIAAIEVAASI